MKIISGTIENTNERCKMVANGFWVAEKGRHVTSYKRVDKEDIHHQFSMDRYHRFWIETED